MPWTSNKQIYLEADITKWFSLYVREQDFLEMANSYPIPEGLELYPMESLLLLLKTYREVLSARRLSKYRPDVEKKELTAHKNSIQKELNEALHQWALYGITLIEAGKVNHHLTGFPCINREYLRKPTSISSFIVQQRPGQKRIRFSCGKKPALLLFFYWAASIDGGMTWVELGKTRKPSFATGKLPPDWFKLAIFRMYMTNPKGLSHYHYWRYPFNRSAPMDWQIEQQQWWAADAAFQERYWK